MAEVLEHLIEDHSALLEARRVLHNTGFLVVSVPFYSDQAEYHVRIHSPQSIYRLLSCAGFEVVTYIERGGLISFPRLIHGLRYVLRNFISSEQISNTVIRIDLFLSQYLRWPLRHSPFYGCYLLACKSKTVDPRPLNVYKFQHVIEELEGGQITTQPEIGR